MSENFKKLLNDDELYAKIIEKVQPDKFDLVENWIPKGRFKEKVDEIGKLKEKSTTYEQQIQEMTKQSSKYKDLQTNFESLNEKYKTDLANKDNEILNITKLSKIESKLKDEGAKFTDLLINKIDMNKLTLDGDNLLGLDDSVKSLKEKYSDLFISKSQNSNQNTNNGSNKNDTSTTNNEDFNTINWEDVAKKFI